MHHADGLKLIWMRFKLGSVGYINIGIEQKNSRDFQPYTAFSCVGFIIIIFLRYDPHKDFLFLFNYLTQSYKDLKEHKQSFYQSITGSWGMYLCAF